MTNQKAPSGRSPLTVLILASLAFAACSSSNPRSQPPTPSSSPTQRVSPEPPPPPPPPPPAEPLTVVIDQVPDEAPPPSLLEASRLARERRRDALPPAVVITNKNLAEYAKRGSLTVATPKAKEEGATAAPPIDGRDETYWRSEVLRLRQSWREAHDERIALEKDAEQLRFRFYAERDIRFRDSEIKPVWDRTLDRLTEVRLEIERLQVDLEVFLDEGRRAGALPGWLDEGIELEPEERPKRPVKDLEEYEAKDPQVIDERSKPR